MSSISAQSSRVTSVSYSFVLQWTLKGKELKDLSEEGSDTSLIRSDLYHLKTAKDLRFYLEIGKSIFSHYETSIKGTKMWSFKVPYIFLMSKGRAFSLKSTNKLSFLTSFEKSSTSDEDDVEIYCAVYACSAHPAPSAKEDDLSLMEGQNTVDLEGTPDISLPDKYTNENVVDFILRGDIPDFNTNLAIDIIRESKEHKCEALKILCVEYLMKNITARSLSEILRVAIDYDLPLLERACTKKIVNGHFETEVISIFFQNVN
ncbi:hypothetical protein AVEN_113204-1 [Araneus ventricosus]|uniref:BTB domain-containing protein n=1 Tax=Araneus ventricosus TaxID=182803 RepID=A0A4Y2MDB9_ARAVE|nr:hypothetical protein AVEN_113204-1 [Araneus ventricosus]